MRKRKPWTKDQFEFLRENAGKLRAVEIAKALGRTPGAVYQKAFELGLALLVHSVTPQSQGVTATGMRFNATGSLEAAPAASPWQHGSHIDSLPRESLPFERVKAALERVKAALMEVMRSVPGDNEKHDKGRVLAYEILASHGGGVKGVRDLKPELYSAVVAGCKRRLSEFSAPTPETGTDNDMIWRARLDKAFEDLLRLLDRAEPLSANIFDYLRGKYYAAVFEVGEPRVAKAGVEDDVVIQPLKTPHRHWSEVDLQVLHAGGTVSQVAKKLRRSPGSIKRMAQRQGISLA